MSKKQLRITKPGLHLAVKGVETPVAVGEVITIEGDIPSSFAGKYIEVGTGEEKELNLGNAKPNAELTAAVAELEKLRSEHSASRASLEDSSRVIQQLNADNEALRVAGQTTASRVAELEKEVADITSQLAEAKKNSNNSNNNKR